jgi:hypothetical protein
MHVSGSLLYYSYCVQPISRLFFVVFYKHTFLLTYHLHFILIAIQWTLGLILHMSMLTSGHRQYQTETSQCFIIVKNVFHWTCCASCAARSKSECMHGN